MKKALVILLLLSPVMLANKNCERAATWGKKSDLVASWAEDHVDFDKDTKCEDCHDDGLNANKRPKSHDISWTREHGNYANIKYGYRDQNVCYLCHTESQCVRCHQQEPPQNHTEHWRLRGHGLQVGLNRSECMTCHRTDFCERCHSGTAPTTHTAAWGRTSNLHCVNCHYPLSSTGAQRCAVCHQSTPSHDTTPNRPNNALHVTGANCRGCHAQTLRHPDNGMVCTTCHRQ